MIISEEKENDFKEKMKKLKTLVEDTQASFKSLSPEERALGWCLICKNGIF